MAIAKGDQHVVLNEDTEMADKDHVKALKQGADHYSEWNGGMVEWLWWNVGMGSGQGNIL